MAVYLHDSHKHASQRLYYLIPINIPILGDITISHRGSRGGLSSSTSVPCTFVSAVPTGIHKAKDEEPLWERLASDLGTALLGSGKLPLAPTTTLLPSSVWNLFWHPLSYAPFPHLSQSAPGATSGPPGSRGECGTHHRVVSVFTNSPSVSIQGWVSASGEKTSSDWATMSQRTCSTTWVFLSSQSWKSDKFTAIHSGTADLKDGMLYHSLAQAGPLGNFCGTCVYNICNHHIFCSNTGV